MARDVRVESEAAGARRVRRVVVAGPSYLALQCAVAVAVPPGAAQRTAVLATTAPVALLLLIRTVRMALDERRRGPVRPSVVASRRLWSPAGGAYAFSSALALGLFQAWDPWTVDAAILRALVFGVLGLSGLGDEWRRATTPSPPRGPGAC